jgi:hypothetical protein
MLWMLYAHDYPRNFWEDVDVLFRSDLTSIRGGNKRIVMFFKRYLGVPIPRSVLIALAPQDDTMRRLRKNGGGRDQLSTEGIALLSGKYHSALIAKLGLPHCNSREFIGVSPVNSEQLALLKSEGFLP